MRLWILALATLVGGTAAQAHALTDSCDRWLAHVETSVTVTYSEQMVAEKLGELRKFWLAEFSRHDWPFEDLHTRFFDEGTISACGPVVRAQGPTYCLRDQTLYLDLAFFKESESLIGPSTDILLTYALGHEYGHHLQVLRGALARAVHHPEASQASSPRAYLFPRAEFQADCLSGYYLNQLSSRGRISDLEIKEAKERVAGFGDEVQLERLESQGLHPQSVSGTTSHGSSGERGEWFSTGLLADSFLECEPYARPVLN